MSIGFSWELFRQVPIVAILRGFTPETAMRLLKCCRDGGLLNIEVTMNSPEAAGVIAEMVEQEQGRMNVGAGTVCGMEELKAALSTGASFVITPAVLPEIIAECRNRSVPIFPGAYTPTEIFAAWREGADIVKVFPAAGLGARYFKDLRGPFPQIKLMPTGGVTVDTLAEFYAAGAVAFSVGSQLFDRTMVEAGEWQQLSDRAAAFVEAYRRASSSAL